MKVSKLSDCQRDFVLTELRKLSHQKFNLGSDPVSLRGAVDQALAGLSLETLRNHDLAFSQSSEAYTSSRGCASVPEGRSGTSSKLLGCNKFLQTVESMFAIEIKIFEAV